MTTTIPNILREVSVMINTGSILFPFIYKLKLYFFEIRFLSSSENRSY